MPIGPELARGKRDAIFVCFLFLAAPAASPQAQQQGALSAEPSVYVRQFRFLGNTAFSEDELSTVVARYARRRLTSADLEQARQELTLHYVNRGYINSGVVLEDQTVEDQTVFFTVMEGKLEDVAIEGNRRLPAWFVRRRVLRRVGVPLSLPALQESLLLLRQNPAIAQINAELKPGPSPGSSRLHLALKEANPWSAYLLARNDRPPSIGAETLEAIGSHGNLSGLGDRLTLRYALLSRSDQGARVPGLDDWGVQYQVPLSPSDATLQLFCERTDFSIIEEPFGELDVSSKSLNLGATIRVPVYRSLRREVALGLGLERRRSRTFLFGEPFSLSPGADEGRSAVTALRASQEWVERSQQQVLALRSTFSWGLDLFHPTKHVAEPDGLFFSWLGQAQYIRRLGRTQHQLFLNSTVQWANDPLLSLEQFSLGGANTVRGYRENQLVRDMGWLASAELRLTLWVSGRADPVLQLVPFLDYGLGWNRRGPTPKPSDIASAGLGLIFTPHPKLSAQIYCGYPFRQFETSQRDLQDYGLHFRLGASIW